MPTSRSQAEGLSSATVPGTPPGSAAPPAPPSDGKVRWDHELDEIARSTRRLDFTAGLLAASIYAVIEMGPAIAKKAFLASDFEIALITSGHSLGLLLTFFTAHLLSSRAKMALVFWPELVARCLLGLMFFLEPGFAMGFVILHALSQMLQAMTIPARVTIYRLNYPTSQRGRIVGRNRQVQLAVTTVMALLLSAALDWSVGNDYLTRLLGASPIRPSVMVNVLIPLMASIGLLGTFLFRTIRVRDEETSADTPVVPDSLRRTAGRFLKVWREDREFRRYESFFILFGFANIMSIPLTQIHAVEVLHADYLDMAVINVVLVQGVMALTMVFWGRLVDRYPPTMLRGILNLLFAVDFLAFAVSPTLGWVFVGRGFRGIALGGGTLIWMLGSLYYARSTRDAPIYMGIHTFLTGLRWAVAPFVGVALKNLCGDSARPIFLISFVVVVITAVGMIRESRVEKQRRLDELPVPPPGR